jgi:DNA repair exonuclease SbcCD ATPase subunit
VEETNAQATEKLIDIARLEERVKWIQPRLDELSASHAELVKAVGVCERCEAEEEISSIKEQLSEIKQRISNLEYLSTKEADRWETITRYIFQAIWIILMAWALTKLNLSAPPLS